MKSLELRNALTSGVDALFSHLWKLKLCCSAAEAPAAPKQQTPSPKIGSQSGTPRRAPDVRLSGAVGHGPKNVPLRGAFEIVWRMNDN